MTPVALAAGTNPLTFQGAYLTTTNHLTESDPLKQTSTSGVSPSPNISVDKISVPSGLQTMDIWVDKNIAIDDGKSGKVFVANQGYIKLKNLVTNSNIPIIVYRLGDGGPGDLYKQHLYFDTNLVGGHSYEIAIDARLIANNGLTLLTTKYVDFTTANDVPAPKPGTPVVTNDDTLNTVTGMATGMEYKLDAATEYVAYDKTTFDALDLSGAHTLLIRVASVGINPASDEVTLIFTANAVSVKPGTPVVTKDDTLNKVTGMATGMEYKLDAATEYVAYDKTTFDALDLSGAHTLLIRVASVGINPASDEVTLIFTANAVSVKPGTPVVTKDDTLNKVTGMATGMEYKLDDAGYVAYNKTTFDALDLSGAHTLLIRVASAGINLPSDPATLTFTLNPVPIKSVTPVVIVPGGEVVTTTVSGGQLPNTSTPLYNELLLIGAALTLVGAVGWKKRKC